MMGGPTKDPGGWAGTTQTAVAGPRGRTGFDPDAIPVLAAALGGLFLTCSALRASYGRRIRGLEQEIVRLSVEADRDHLTGLGNRRSFDRCLAMEWRRALRHGSHLTLALVDVDHFKLFNDTYGHPAGDEALRVVARCLAATLGRSADCAFRVGGEEFALILPDTDRDGAGVVAGRMREKLRSVGLTYRSSPTGCVTASFGACSTIVRDGELTAKLLRLADEALYDAKHAGRDRAVCVSSRPPASTDMTDNTLRVRAPRTSGPALRRLQSNDDDIGVI